MPATLTFLSPLTAIVLAGILAGIVLCFALLRWLGGPPAAISRRHGLFAIRAATVATLMLILLNPADVTQSPGPIDRPDMFYLLDSSQSMAVGDEETRFEHALRLIREAEAAAANKGHAEVKLFRFGHRLAAIDAGGLAPSQAKQQTLTPTDSDTQLLAALRQVSSRFGRRPPAGIVLFSDGRARDENGLEQIAQQFAALKVPVHVAPLGDTAKGGDVAIVACVVPPRVRRFTEVEVQVFLRSYGYEGRRCEVSIAAPGSDGESAKSLAPSLPVTLHDGFQSVALSFRSEPKTRKLQVTVTALPDEVSTANNTFAADVIIDRTKIRVLYVEGSSQPLQPVQRGDKYEVRGPYTDLQQALLEDEDIECVVLTAPSGRSRLARVSETGGVTAARGFPETVAELSAFDAIILSDVSADSFSEQQLQWLENWVGQRGAGLLMVGGQRSFSAGNWHDTPLANMLPIAMRTETDWLPGTQVRVRADAPAYMHPLWTIVTDEQQNRKIVEQFPAFFGANRWSGVKPNLATVLAVSNLAAAEAPVAPVASTPARPSFFQNLQRNMLGQPASASNPPANAPAAATPGKPATGNAKTASQLMSDLANQPAIVAGRYGRGRTMAMAMPITAPWANDFHTKWGSGDARYYGKFWRNAVYWLTESSSVGRRRLIVAADKKFYRPGETITLTASAYDEAANQTGAYKILSMIEPQTALGDLESNYAPIRWPEGKPRESGETGSFIAWGEEFDLPRSDTAGGKPGFSLELPIADALTVGSASQSLRIELTAMEESTQVDSTSLDIQILHDPFEQQNPFPNHELLTAIARQSGGRAIHNSTELAELLCDVPMTIGAPVIRETPLWSNWWLWSWLLGLLTVEWIWRRVVGLA